MGVYQAAGSRGCVHESTVKWSGKNEFWSGKSQGISFQTKSGHPGDGSFEYPQHMF